MAEQKIFKVSELDKYVKAVLANEPVLSNVWVAGEVTSCKLAAAGHNYFALKDEDTSEVVNCALFKYAREKAGYQPKNGDKVIVCGHFDMYTASGNVQIIVSAIKPDGIGKLLEEYERLKRKLFSEGLFELSHKKKLPYLPRAVGAITAETGAVIHDIRTTLGRRFPGMPIILYPIPVQGKDAPPKIIEAIKRAGGERKCDVLILARGGGSMEDLWCFNDETLARTVFDCEIPIITAIGHEVDTTLVDLVSDMRAATPTAAAELAAPEKWELVKKLREAKIRIGNSCENTLKSKREALSLMQRTSALKNPKQITDNYHLKVDGLAQRLSEVKTNIISGKRDNLSKKKEIILKNSPREMLTRENGNLAVVKGKLTSAAEKHKTNKASEILVCREKLMAFDPNNVLKRGYAMLQDENGNVITDGISLGKGSRFTVKQSTGAFEAEKI